MLSSAARARRGPPYDHENPLNDLESLARLVDETAVDHPTSSLQQGTARRTQNAITSRCLVIRGMFHAAEHAEGILAYTKNSIPGEQRPFHGQSLPLGDRGGGDVVVPSDEQGISNRPGDRPDGMSAQADKSAGEDEENEDEIELDDEELDDESDNDGEDDEEEDDEEEDEQTDPGSEPGKPI
jgi:hypothetical protein